MVEVKLKVLRGANAGKEIPIRAARFLIGRAEECSLRAASEAISRRHCVLSIADADVVIEDLGSKNGTFVNGRRLDQPHKLLSGDQVRIGPLEFLVTVTAVATTGDTLTPLNEKTALIRNAPTDDAEMGGMVSEWLAEADEVERKRRLAEPETREFRLESTGQKTEGTAKPADSKGTKREKSKTKDKQQKTQTAHKAPKSKSKDATKDSQEAAAQILRRLMNRG